MSEKYISKVQAGLNEKVISNINRLLDTKYQSTNLDYSFPFGVYVLQQGRVGLVFSPFLLLGFSKIKY